MRVAKFSGKRIGKRKKHHSGNQVGYCWVDTSGCESWTKDYYMRKKKIKIRDNVNRHVVKRVQEYRPRMKRTNLVKDRY